MGATAVGAAARDTGAVTTVHVAVAGTRAGARQTAGGPRGSSRGGERNLCRTRVDGALDTRRGKEVSTCSGESWPGRAGADTRPHSPTPAPSHCHYPDSAGGAHPPLLDPRRRTVPLPAPRTRVRSRATGSETNRPPQICKQRSEEPSAAARRRPPPSSFSHPPHPRSRPRRDRCSALPPQRHRTYIYAIFCVHNISTMSRAPEGAHSRTPALASGADTDPSFVAATKQRPAGAWES